MDDDRLARAREGDLDAFLELVRPRARRLLRLAAIGAGDPAAAERAAATAGRATWRDVRRFTDTARLDQALEQALVAGLPRRYGTYPTGRRSAGSTASRRPHSPDSDELRPRAAAPADVQLQHALRTLAVDERVALARCLDPSPDAAAWAVAGRLGVEVGPYAADPAVGRRSGDATAAPEQAAVEIVDLDGPLAGWDLARLRGALVTATQLVGLPHPDDYVDDLRGPLAGSRPDGRLRVALRAAHPGRTTVARGAALALAAVVGFGALVATVPGGTGPDTAGDGAVASPTTDDPGRGPATGEAPADDERAARDAAALGGFPAEVEGIAVVDLRQARSLARDPAALGRTIAIKGWLAPPTLRDRCLVPAGTTLGQAGAPTPASEPIAIVDPISAAAAFCHRSSVLRESPDGSWVGAHLHPQLLPGTGLGRARRIFASQPERLIPVVVLGHFGDPRVATCATGGRHCGEELVVERIAWVYGASTRPAVAVRPAGPAMETAMTGWDAMKLAQAAYSGVRSIAVAGVPAADLATVEPAAADVQVASGFAWLVRAILEPQPGDRGATRTWLVVDDRSGRVEAEPGAVAQTGVDGGGFLFPRQVDGATVRTTREALALVEQGLPDGTAVAVAGWLGAPSLAGACLGAESDPDRSAAPGRSAELDAAFCRRAATLRGPTPDGPALSLQLAPGTPILPTGEIDPGPRSPAPVVALVVAGSPRSEPCWPTDDGCGRQLLLERLLWLDGRAPGVGVAVLDRPGIDPPRLSAEEVRRLVEAEIGDRPVVSIVGVPTALRRDVAPGSETREVGGDHAWIVRIRSPLTVPGSVRSAGLERLWWLMVDDASGRILTGSRPNATGGPLPVAVVPAV